MKWQEITSLLSLYKLAENSMHMDNHLKKLFELFKKMPSSIVLVGVERGYALAYWLKYESMLLAHFPLHKGQTNFREI